MDKMNERNKTNEKNKVNEKNETKETKKNKRSKNYYTRGGTFMEELRTILEKRKEYLLQIKRQKEKSLAKAPEGRLRVCSRKGKPQYYRRSDSQDLKGEYIKKNDHRMVMALAQKDYDQKVLKAGEEELQAIAQYLRNCPAVPAEQVYENLNPERQKLIMPIRETDDQYVSEWAAKEYLGKSFDESMPELYTARGERVRSKSEVIIADLLVREGIPYKYECPLYLDGWGQVYPDFTVLNVWERKVLFWEHLGMMDDPVYAEHAVAKIDCYEQNGIFLGKNLILTFETQKRPLNQKQIMRLVQQYLK